MKIKELLTQIVPYIIGKPKEPEFPSGLSRLDDLLWGFKRKEVAVIAGRTSQGKTSFSLFIAYNLAIRDKKVVFFSLEMSKEAIAERILAMITRIDNEKLLKNELTEADIMEIKCKLDDFFDIEFYIHDDMGFKWQDVEGYVRSAKPDIIFIDYVQMISSTDHQNERLAYAEFVRQSKVIAKKYNIAVVLNSQINRQAVEDKITPDIPRLHQLKGSGVLEENVDVVIIVHWHWKYNKKLSDENKYPRNTYSICVAKNRNGRTGVIKIQFAPEYYYFFE